MIHKGPCCHHSPQLKTSHHRTTGLSEQLNLLSSKSTVNWLFFEFRGIQNMVNSWLFWYVNFFLDLESEYVFFGSLVSKYWSCNGFLLFLLRIQILCLPISWSKLPKNIHLCQFGTMFWVVEENITLWTSWYSPHSFKSFTCS